MTNAQKFTKELEALSRKYGIVIQSIGGVYDHPDMSKFEGYDADLDSGDLIPNFSEDEE